MAHLLELRSCGDCGVDPGWPHEDGCDVARCTECGWQRIGCEHGDSELGWGQTWTGVWPGEAECRELGLVYANGDPMLNELMTLAFAGGVVWSTDRQRWVRRERYPVGVVMQIDGVSGVVGWTDEAGAERTDQPTRAIKMDAVPAWHIPGVRGGLRVAWEYLINPRPIGSVGADHGARDEKGQE